TDREPAAPCVGSHFLERLDAISEGRLGLARRAVAAVRPIGAAQGNPAVAVLNDAIESAGAVATDEDRRVRLLDRLRPRPDGIEGDKLAGEFGLVLRPDFAHREDAL